MKALTEEQSEMFHAITSGEYDNFVLVSTEFQGQDVAVIAAYEESEDDIVLAPLAILIDSENEAFFMSNLEDPTVGLVDDGEAA